MVSESDGAFEMSAPMRLILCVVEFVRLLINLKVVGFFLNFFNFLRIFLFFPDSSMECAVLFLSLDFQRMKLILLFVTLTFLVILLLVSCLEGLIFFERFLWTMKYIPITMLIAVRIISLPRAKIKLYMRAFISTVFSPGR